MKIKNDQGYALITVLLIIVVFMIIAVSVMSQSFNTMKQTQTEEKKSQSTAIAEMGISYYQTMIQNIYNSNQQSINNQINHDSTLNTNDEYAKQAANLMYNTIKQEINKHLAQVNIDGKTNTFFVISSSNFDDTNHKITLKVDGVVENGPHTSLSTDITIAPATSGGSQSGGTSPFLSITINGVLTGFHNILSLGILCKDPSSLSLNSSTGLLCFNANAAIITGDKPDIQGLNNLSNIKYFSLGNLTIYGNMNNMDKIKIHSDGSLNITGNANNSKNILIETVKDATFNKNLQIDSSSKMYVGGNLDVNDQLVINNNSTVYIAGNATIDKNLTIDSTSTLCVSGLLKVNGDIKGSPQQIILNSSADFQAKCTQPTSQTVQIDWPTELFSNISYEYN